MGGGKFSYELVIDDGTRRISGADWNFMLDLQKPRNSGEGDQVEVIEAGASLPRGEFSELLLK